jgi:hypothetical protein
VIADATVARVAGLAVGAGRTALGIAALLRPAPVAAPWVGMSSVPVRVLGRALGGRDLALGIGTLLALADRKPTRAGATWVGAAALADTADLVATLLTWRELPPLGRFLVAAASGGAAIVGAGAAAVLTSAAE